MAVMFNFCLHCSLLCRLGGLVAKRPPRERESRGLNLAVRRGVIPETSTGLVYSQFPFSVSAQDGIVALGKAHTRSVPSLSSLPKVTLETVPMFVWLVTDRSRPWRMECRPLPFPTPVSFKRSMLSCSGLSMFRKFLKPHLLFG